MKWNDEIKHQRKIIIGWELINEMMEPNKDGKTLPFAVWQRYTLSGFQNATLRKHLESWRAKSFTDDEFAAFDISKLLEVPALLTLSMSKDDKYTNVTGIGPLPKGSAIKKLVNEPQKLILSNEDFDQAVFDSLSDGLKKTIEASPEYQAIKSGKLVESFNELDGDELPF